MKLRSGNTYKPSLLNNTCIICYSTNVKVEPVENIAFFDVFTNTLFISNCSCNIFIHQNCYSRWCYSKYHYFNENIEPKCIICKQRWIPWTPIVMQNW